MTRLRELAVGQIVKLKINGVFWDWIIINQGNPDANIYDSSCNGTWLLLKNIYTTGAFGTSNNEWPTNTMGAYLNGEFYNAIDEHDKKFIKLVKLPYAYDWKNTRTLADGASLHVFALDFVFFHEIGGYGGAAAITGVAPYLAATYNGTPTAWWTRSPFFAMSSSSDACAVNAEGFAHWVWSNSASEGMGFNGNSTTALGYRPCVICESGATVHREPGGWALRNSTLGALSVGTVVKAAGYNWLVVNQGNPDASIYDNSCAGTWLLSETCVASMAHGNVNYSQSAIHAYLNGEFYNSLAGNFKSAIKQVKIPWGLSAKSANTGANGLSCRAFALSFVEAGDPYTVDGATLELFKPVRGSSRDEPVRACSSDWWTRSVSGTAGYMQFISAAGSTWYKYAAPSEAKGVRPCVICNPTTPVCVAGGVIKISPDVQISGLQAKCSSSCSFSIKTTGAGNCNLRWYVDGIQRGGFAIGNSAVGDAENITQASPVVENFLYLKINE